MNYFIFKGSLKIKDASFSLATWKIHAAKFLKNEDESLRTFRNYDKKQNRSFENFPVA